VDEWGLGSYEQTAGELAPASQVAVAALELTGGERVLDVACGTGNAALVAHAAGGRVVGIDGSPRLLEVARGRVPEAEFVLGDAAALPFDDGAFDAAVSVFGVIFARPADAAAREIARVVRPGGRVVVTTWPARGPVFEVVALMRAAIARVRGAAGPAPVDWGDPAVLRTLLGAHGEVEVGERLLPLHDATPEQVWDRWERLHPMWIGARALLEPAGAWDGLRDASIAALHDAGPASDSPYLLAILTRR
jgi:SAM-dependent methyltransferase